VANPGVEIRQWLQRAALVLLLLVFIASVLALLAPLGWPFELFSHFRLQYGVAAGGLALALVLLRQGRPALIALLLSVVHLLPFMPAQRAEAARQGCGGPQFSVVTANLWFRNDEQEALQRIAGLPQADLVVLQELTPAGARQAASLDAFPYKRLIPRDDPYGIGVLSRWPLDVEVADLAGDGLPSLRGSLQLPDASVHFLGLHTRWPLQPKLAVARDRALAAAAAWAASQEEPAVVLGDLNLTPQSPAYGRLLSSGRLSDAFRRGGWQPTWMAGFWPLALRIDHVLVTPGVCVEFAAVGEDIGSDHRPVLVRLRLPR
jgi:endonuclease/exonuclease/phosphatase (EEP) superfamily protein YafD